MTPRAEAVISDVIQQAEATSQILAQVRPLASRVVPLAQSLDCYAARDVFATLSLPPFDNSAMDGYAVAADSCGARAKLRVVGEQPAGRDRALMVRSGEAVRIFTGAPLPAGADAVVMQEDVFLHGDEVQLSESVAAGDFVRRQGGDVAAGQKILSTGERVRPETIALLAAQGAVSVEIGGLPRAAIVSTGDELASPGTTLRPGQVYESNSALLQALLRRLGVEVASVTHCADRAEEIEAAVRAAVENAEILIISGGVSVGARDFVKGALTSAGASLDLWRVAVKPGKPFVVGHTERCAIFGLPGNPVSAFVTFLLFVRPALLRMMGAGASTLLLPQTTARVAKEICNEGDRPHFIRGALGAGLFTPVGRQESHALFGLSRSNALLRVEPRSRLAAGESATIYTWD